MVQASSGTASFAAGWPVPDINRSVASPVAQIGPSVTRSASVRISDASTAKSAVLISRMKRPLIADAIRAAVGFAALEVIISSSPREGICLSPPSK